MIYRVLMDGLDIYDASKDMILISPTVSMELNTSGSFDFVIPPSHLFYDEIKLMKSIISVYEGEELIFFGRPSEIKKGWLNQKAVHCEGVLSYLNDVILRPIKYEKIQITSFFRNVIDEYNKLVSDDKKFIVGNITVDNRYVDREISYQNPFDVISESCIETNGGYIFVRYSDGKNYIDWLKDMPYSSDQPIQFGINLLDITSDVSCSDIASVIIPLGDTITDSEGKETIVTIASVNEGKDYLEIPIWKDTYGKVEKTIKFDGISKPADLLTAARNYINNIITDLLVIDCDAADLHFQNKNFHQFKVGQTVNVASTPHDIVISLPLTKIDVDISTAIKKIRIGTPPRDGISSMSSGTSSGNTTQSGGGGGGGGVVTQSSPFEIPRFQLAGSNGVVVDTFAFNNDEVEFECIESSSGWEGFNIPVQGLTKGSSYRITFDLQFVDTSFIGSSYVVGFTVSKTNRTDYNNTSAWPNNINRDLDKHSYSIDFTAETYIEYLTFNVSGLSDDTINRIKVTNMKLSTY